MNLKKEFHARIYGMDTLGDEGLRCVVHAVHSIVLTAEMGSFSWVYSVLVGLKRASGTHCCVDAK